MVKHTLSKRKQKPKNKAVGSAGKPQNKAGSGSRNGRTNIRTVFQIARGLKEANDRLAAVRAEKALYDAKYVMVDVKGTSADPFSDKIQLIQTQITALKGEAESVMKGNNNYLVELSTNFLWASTVTTGVVNTVNSIQATNFGDFSALAGLFEEYKIVSGAIRFVPGVFGASASTTPANTGNMMLAMEYSTNNTALTSVALAIDDGMSKLYAVPTIDAAGRALVAPKQGEPYHFSFHIPEGITLTGAGPLSSSAYILTSDSTSTWGYLKSYMVAATATATANAIHAVGMFKFHFRIRI